MNWNNDYETQPERVTAVQVTEENIGELMAEVGGWLVREDGDFWIEWPTAMWAHLHTEECWAGVGDWVVDETHGAYKGYRPLEFHQWFKLSLTAESK